MLSGDVVELVLARSATQTIGVLGDLFLDRYLDLDAALSEPSIETGLDAYQVTAVRAYPGAAGTVINNLAALGVRSILPVSMIGDDGEGHELRQALQRMPGVEPDNLVTTTERRTPTYTKPMLRRAGAVPRELNRLDIKNRAPLPTDVVASILRHLEIVWRRCDGLLVLDQVSEPECGVITTVVRERLARLAEEEPGKIVIADSRQRIGSFRNVWLKPNEQECIRAVPGDLVHATTSLARQTRCPVFCTRGEAGMLVVEPKRAPVAVPAYRVDGPIDPVGAGDSSSAGLMCALVSGASLVEAAAFANLVASITIQQLGTTGTATPAQVRARWAAVTSGSG